MSKAEQVVREYLAAMERRDLVAARTSLAPGFFMVFPGGARFDSLEALVESARSRYRSAKKTYERFDTFDGGVLDGTPYSGVRFIDRFTVRDGKLVDQRVWNDLAQTRGPGKPA